MAFLYEAWTQFKRSPLRAVLAAAGMAVAVGAMVLLANLVGSTFRAVTAGLRDMGSNTIVVQPEFQSLGRIAFGRPVSMGDVEAVRRQVPNLDIVAPVVSVQGMVSACGTRRVIRIVGVLPEHAVVDNWRLTKGRFVRLHDVRTHEKIAVIGSSVVEKLRCIEIGSPVRLSGHAYTVVGVLEPRGQRLGVKLDDTILIPLSTAEAKYRQVVRSALGVILRVRQGSDVSEAKEAVRRLLRQRHALRAEDDDDFLVQTQGELVANVRLAASFATYFTIILVSVSLVVAAVGVLNSQLTAVLERTGEIGLRRCVGATQLSIRVQFLVEAMAIAGLGSIAGTGAGVGLSAALARALEIPPYINIPVIAIAVLSALGLGVLAGVIPAIRAASLDPVKALHQE